MLSRAYQLLESAADRAFGAQRSGLSGGRAALRAAFGFGQRFALLWGAFGAPLEGHPREEVLSTQTKGRRILDMFVPWPPNGSRKVPESSFWAFEGWAPQFEGWAPSFGGWASRFEAGRPTGSYERLRLAKTSKPNPKTAEPRSKTSKPRPKPRSPTLKKPGAQPQISQMGPKVTLWGTCHAVRGFCRARPARWLGFGVLKLGFEDLAGGSAKGSSGGG